jgi:hypothetical protein
MSLDWQRTLPVIVSIFIIIGIAILRNYSKNAAAILVVMPMNITLGLWIVYTGEENPQSAMIEFSGALFANIIPTLLFMVTVWQAARAGWSLVPAIVAGYTVWAVGVGVVIVLRTQLGA